jgi:Methylase involved in ubiquinone/menaquinone biosynthesis
LGQFQETGAILNQFGIKPGFTVVDYGCGPGRYLEAAVSLVGENGFVYAADISEVGIEYTKKRIATKKLHHVVPVLLEPDKIIIPDACADLVYALDMFHRIDDPVLFFESVRRIVKKGGLFFLEEGHQPREETLKKIGTTDLWEVNTRPIAM